METYFVHDKRLGIDIPSLNWDWTCYPAETQSEILFRWEEIKGGIPDLVKELEMQINEKWAVLNAEEDFEKSCLLNDEISELASCINDLWIWFRINEELSSKPHR
ncbi:hypothetical protein [Pradoshia sp.]